MIVVDASVLAPALVDDSDDGARARAVLRGEDLAAPHLIDLEVVSALRRARSRGEVTARRARQALEDLAELPIVRAGHSPFLSRVWELHGSVTPYDAVYVALAEALAAPLVTADERLARAPGTACEFILVK